MHSKKVRNLFIFFFLLLPFQYGLTGFIGFIYTDPWPAFTFPGFKSVNVYQDLYEIPKDYFEVYNTRGEKTGTFKSYQFFPDLPRSQIAGFMRTHFADSSAIESLSSDAKNWLKNHSRQLTDVDVGALKFISTVEYYRRTPTGLELDSTEYQFTAVIPLDNL